MVKIGLTFRVLVAVIAAALFWAEGTQDPGKVGDIAGVLASVCGTLFGFMLAAITILLTMPGKRLIENFKKTGHFKYLMDDAFESCVCLFIVLVLSVFSVVANDGPARITLTVGIFFAVVALMTTLLAGRKMALVIDAIA